MDSTPARRPLARPLRRATHGALALSVALTLAFFARLAAEPHVALGVDVLADRVVAHVSPGSVAARAGLREGEPVAGTFTPAGWQQALADPAAPLILPVVREGRTVAVRLPRAATPLPDQMPSYKWIVLACCLLLAFTGWAIFARYSDVDGIALLALAAALTGLAFVPANRSLLWTAEMARLESVWSLIFETLYHALLLHWLIVFVGVSRRFVPALYGGSVLLLIALLVASADGKPESALNTAAGLTGLATLALCLAGLRDRRPLRARRQASWVFLAYVLVSLLDLALWEAPPLFGFAGPLPERVVNTAMVAASLIVTAAYVAALAGRGLFATERVATRALAYTLALAVLAGLYVGGAGLVGRLVGGTGGALPLAWGAALAGVVGLAAAPVGRRARALVDRAFDRPRLAADAALAAFDRAQASAPTSAALNAAFATAVRDGLGAEAHVLAGQEAASVTVRPGAADLARPGAVVLDAGLPPDVALGLPLGLGVAHVGPRRGAVPFSDADLAFLGALARRYGEAAERLRLQRAVVERELALATARLRIAADLHDDVGASLASIALTGDRLARRAGLDAPQREGTARMARTARETADALRDIVWSIQPGTDAADSLVLRMKDAATALFPDGTCRFALDADALPDTLSMDVRRDLFLAYKEALTNAARHGRAGAVSVALTRDGDTVRLVVRDDGDGFSPATARRGGGTRTLGERAARLGGTATVTSTPGVGTTVTLTARIPDLRDGAEPAALLP